MLQVLPLEDLPYAKWSLRELEWALGLRAASMLLDGLLNMVAHKPDYNPEPRMPVRGDPCEFVCLLL